MQITVFGANGRVGSRVVKRALEKGYTVRAFVHGSSPFDAHDRLIIVEGDIYKKEDVARALIGSEAVVSALGSWGTKGKDVLSKGMEMIIPEMQAAGIKRIISLTGADARYEGDRPDFVHRLSRLMIGIVGGKVITDGEEHMRLLQISTLEWTVIRSPVMNEKGSTDYSVGQAAPYPWETINRQSVAEAMVEQLSKSDHIRIAPFIRRK